MADGNEVKEVVFSAIEELNEQLPKGRQMEKNLEKIIFGDDGLDSLDLINLLVAVEGAVEDKFGMAVSLLDEKAMADLMSQYRTTGGLVEYVDSLVNKK